MTAIEIDKLKSEEIAHLREENTLLTRHLEAILAEAERGYDDALNIHIFMISREMFLQVYKRYLDIKGWRANE